MEKQFMRQIGEKKRSISGVISLTALIVGLLYYTGCTGMADLWELKNNEGAIENELAEETEIYQRLKDALMLEELQEGMTDTTIIRQYGPPVLALDEDDGYRFIYKPGDANWLGGEKIDLVFGVDRKLVEWQHRLTIKEIHES